MLRQRDWEEKELLVAVAPIIDSDPEIKASLLQHAFALKPQLADECAHESLSAVVSHLDPCKDKGTIQILLDSIQQQNPMFVVQAKKGKCPERLTALREALSDIDLAKKNDREVLEAVRKCISGLEPKRL